MKISHLIMKNRNDLSVQLLRIGVYSFQYIRLLTFKLLIAL
jgi:hypothetical protein